MPAVQDCVPGDTIRSNMYTPSGQRSGAPGSGDRTWMLKQVQHDDRGDVVELRNDPLGEVVAVTFAQCAQPGACRPDGPYRIASSLAQHDLQHRILVARTVAPSGDSLMNASETKLRIVGFSRRRVAAVSLPAPRAPGAASPGRTTATRRGVPARPAPAGSVARRTMRGRPRQTGGRTA